MPYSPVTFVDGVTPLNKATFDGLQAGVIAAERVEFKAVANGYASLDATGKVPAAQLPASSGGVGPITATGKTALTFTDTTTTTGFTIGGDTNLYRLSANTLQSDGALQLGSGLRLLSNTAAGFAGVSWGPTSDTNLYRSAAGVLKTDGAFQAGSTAYANTGLSSQVITGFATGQGVIAGLAFGPGATGDTNLYRSAAGVLKTDSQFITSSEIDAGTYVIAGSGTAHNVVLGYSAGPASAISFGGASGSYDTSLYRSAAGVLATNGPLVFATNAAGQGIFWLDASGAYGGVQRSSASGQLLLGSQVGPVAAAHYGNAYMGVQRHPYGTDRHMEAGAISSGPGGATVSFTAAFSSTPSVVATPYNTVANPVSTGAPSTAGVTIYSSVGTTVSWQAEGPN